MGEIEKDEQQAQDALAAKIQLGAMYRVMCQSGAFADLKRELDAKVTDLRNRWLTADEAEGAKIKLRAQVYNEVFDLIKSKILAGDMAARTLKNLKDAQES